MTREEAIKIINCYDIGFCDLSGEKIPADKLVEALDMAIKALKQQPVLDKIRAEIMSLTNGDTPERIWNVDVLEILDKYNAESGKEDEK